MRERRSGGRGRPRTPKKVREYEKRVAWTAAKELGAIGGDPLIKSKVFLACHFVFDDARIGDLSNYVKIIEDALNGKEMVFQKYVKLHNHQFERGDKATIGKVWTDDRHVQALNPIYTFGERERVDIAIIDAEELHHFPEVLLAYNAIFGT